MTLKAYGVVGSLDTIHFNKIGEDAGRANAPMAVMAGLDVSLVTGLTLAIAPGRSYQANSIAILDDVPSRQYTLGARSTGNRIDRLVLQVDFTKGQDDAASILAVPGRSVTTGSPVPPQLIQDVLTQRKWQTPLAQILVPPTGAITITDDRPGLSNNLPFKAMAISGTTWAQDTATFGVQRVGDWVEMTGAINRSGAQLLKGDSATFGGTPLIPEGYRPKRAVVAHGVSGVTVNDISEQRFIFLPDGTCTMYVIQGTLATGRVVRLDTTTYLGA